MRVLVTGSSGRLGPFVVRELARAGHEMVLFSRKKPSGEMPHLAWVEGDITDYGACERAVGDGVDCVQHLAAQPYPTDHPELRERAQEQGLPFDTTMRSNIVGTYSLLQAAVRKGVKTFVMTGSNCALGHGYRISGRAFPFERIPVDETHPSEVEDAYSYSKLACEELLKSYTRGYGMRTYAVRAAGICDGERRRRMAETVKAAERWNPWLWAWVGSEDVASAHRLLMEKAERIDPHGVFFCNGDDSTALEPTRELIAKFRPELVGRVLALEGHASILSNRKLKETVGWTHETRWRR